MEMILDNEETGCREVHIERVLTSAAPALSIPKIAIEMRLTPMYAPWGTYAKPTGWGQHNGARVKKNRSGVKRSAEETALLTQIFDLWEAIPAKGRGNNRMSLAQFIATLQQQLPPDISQASIAMFFVQERKRRHNRSKRADLKRNAQRDIAKPTEQDITL